MSKYPNLTEADSVIMELLWRDGEAGSNAITEEIEDKLNWSRQTVRTYLTRLMEKGLIDARKINERVLRYYPIVSREEYAADKAKSLCNKYYGNISQMVAGIVDNENISESDLNELENLIKQMKRQEGK